jgi:hypothetical protein
VAPFGRAQFREIFKECSIFSKKVYNILSDHDDSERRRRQARRRRLRGRARQRIQSFRSAPAGCARLDR